MSEIKNDQLAKLNIPADLKGRLEKWVNRFDLSLYKDFAMRAKTWALMIHTFHMVTALVAIVWCQMHVTGSYETILTTIVFLGLIMAVFLALHGAASVVNKRLIQKTKNSSHGYRISSALKGAIRVYEAEFALFESLYRDGCIGKVECDFRLKDLQEKRRRIIEVGSHFSAYIEGGEANAEVFERVYSELSPDLLLNREHYERLEDFNNRLERPEDIAEEQQEIPVEESVHYRK